MEGIAMIALVTATIILILLVAIGRWIAAVPLVRTLSASIDTWADGVLGHEAEPLV